MDCSYAMAGIEPPALTAAAPVAGIPIIHESTSGIQILADADSGGADTGANFRPLKIRHVIERVDTSGMRERMVVLDRIRYLEAPDATIAVRLPGDSVNGASTLCTTVPGYEYLLAFDETPRGPVRHRGAELTAYALALSARQHGVFAHGCGLVTPSGRGILALGVSGAGKSTLARIMRGVPDWRVLNDDRVVLTRDAGAFRAWATPWPGTEGIAGRGSARLGAIAFIGRSPHFTVSAASGGEILRRLLRTLLVPFWSANETMYALDFITEMIECVPIVELAYPLTERTSRWIAHTLEEVAR